MAQQRRTRQQRQAEGSGMYPTTPEEPTGGPRRCEAHGCYLPGTVSPGLRGEGPWMCVFHSGEAYGTLDAITAWLRQHRPMLDALDLAMCSDGYNWELRGGRDRAEQLSGIKAAGPGGPIAYAQVLVATIRRGTREAGDKAGEARRAMRRAEDLEDEA